MTQQPECNQPASIAPTAKPPGLRARKVEARRDHVLSVAARLFREKGYTGVGMDEIGSTAGFSGPALYKYFDSKAAILAAILARGNAKARAMLAQIDSDGRDPLVVLKERIQVYIDFSGIERDGMTVAVREAGFIPPWFLEDFLREQRDIREESVRILLLARPELSAADARFICTNVFQGLISSSVYLYPINSPARRRLVAAMALSALMA